jgi:peptide/nickel transport system permease protein
MLVIRKFVRDKSAVLGLSIVLAAIVVAMFSEWLAPLPLDAYESHPLLRLQPPSAEHLFGTDNLGRDVCSRVILGTRNALIIATMVVALSVLIGVPLGLFAGYFGGWLSDLIMRVTDVFLAVPRIILALALAQLLSPSIESLILALAVTYWPFFCRLIYAETRRLKAALFVEALEALGAGGFRVMFMHILLNAISPIIIRMTIGMGFTILTAAILSFLGMGPPPPDPDWGLAIAESRQYLPENWWFATFPGLAIFLVVFGFNLLGDGLRDIADPHLRRSR